MSPIQAAKRISVSTWLTIATSLFMCLATIGTVWAKGEVWRARLDDAIAQNAVVDEKQQHGIEIIQEKINSIENSITGIDTKLQMLVPRYVPTSPDRRWGLEGQP